MKRAYIESSAVNFAVNRGLSPSTMISALSKRGLVPVVGLHVVYELARTFLCTSGQETGRELFGFLERLNPSFSPGSRSLIFQEAIRLRTGAAVLPFLDHLDQAATRTEIIRLANGMFDERARAFIATRENSIRRQHPRQMSDYLAQLDALRAANPAWVSEFHDFEALVDHFQPMIPRMIHNLFERQVSTDEAHEFAIRLESFPALRAKVRSDLYLTWICVRHGDKPGVDKLADYRHLIEASYCEAFVTNDAQLHRTTTRISGSIQVVASAELL